MNDLIYFDHVEIIDHVEILDSFDEIIVGHLEADALVLTPGEEATLTLGLINNGDKIALFTPTVEEWLPGGRATIQPSHTRLHPGERTSFTITLSIPRHSSLKPGIFDLNITVRSPAYLEQICELGAQVTIPSIVDCQVGRLQPAELKTSWRTPTAMTHVPLKNNGNVPVQIEIQGHDSRHECVYDFAGGSLRAKGYHQSRPLGRRLLHPGQTEYSPVTITPRRIKAFSMAQNTISFRLMVNYGEVDTETRFVDQQVRTQTIYGQLTHRAVVGPGTVLAIAVSALVGMIVIGLALVLFLVALSPSRSVSTLPRIIAPSTKSTTNAAGSSQGALEVIIKVAEPIPTPVAEGSSPGSGINNPALASVASARSAIQNAGNPLTANNGTQAGEVPITLQSDNVQAITGSGSISGSEGVISGPTPIVVRPDMVSLPGGNNPDGTNPTGENGESDSTETLTNIDGVPIVQPNMVTTPGEVNGAAYIPSATEEERTVVAPPPADTGDTSNYAMTYEEMFQLIAVYYDLDWRMLAAQAYVESSFNPLALGKMGDLGLMQILPTTWHEWAPRVDAQDPFDSYSNVLVAGVYLDYLRSVLAAQGYTELKWILIAYNWGPNQLNNFFQQGGTWESLPEPRKKYAQDIIRIGESLPID